MRRENYFGATGKRQCSVNTKDPLPGVAALQRIGPEGEIRSRLDELPPQLLF
jgi:hypothetical protein